MYAGLASHLVFNRELGSRYLSLQENGECGRVDIEVWIGGWGVGGGFCWIWEMAGRGEGEGIALGTAVRKGSEMEEKWLAGGGGGILVAWSRRVLGVFLGERGFSDAATVVESRFDGGILGLSS